MGKESTDILLVGKTGNGKSATANSIIGHKAFKTGGDQTTVTKEIQFDVGEFKGRAIKVVDSPGVGATSLKKTEAFEFVADAMTYAVAVNPAGYHCILVVLKYGCRLTQEETDTVRMLKQIFGDNFIRYHAIVVFTCGDNFVNDDNKNFEEFIKHQTDRNIKEIVDECCGRVLLFDNSLKNRKKQKEQRQRLLMMIDRLTANCTRYTSDIFDKAQKSRCRVLQQPDKPALRNETLIECGLINQQLNFIDLKNPVKAVHLLEDLKKRAEKLYEDIKLQDKETKTLSVSISLAQKLKDNVNERITAAQEVLKSRDSVKQAEQELKFERNCLKSEKNKLKEDERKRLKESDEKNLEEFERQKQVQERLWAQIEDEMKKKMESIKGDYEALKEKESWNWRLLHDAIKEWMSP